MTRRTRARREATTTKGPTRGCRERSASTTFGLIAPILRSFDLARQIGYL